MITSPLIASKITKSPDFNVFRISFTPTIAGISKERAMIALWLVRPPISVAKPFANSLFKEPVSDGVKSLATTTTGSFNVLRLGISFPVILQSKRNDTSLISAALARMYSSSMLSNIEIIIFDTQSAAYSAFTEFDVISFSIEARNSGSPIIIRCASKIANSSSANVFDATSLICSISAIVFVNALSNFFNSSSGFALVCTILRTGCSNLYTFAIAIPCDAAIPFNMS